MSLVQAEIVGEHLQAKLAPAVVEKPVVIERSTEPVLKTEFLDITPSVNGTLKVLEKTGQGTLEKLLIRSPSPDYGVILVLDGRPQLKGDWDDFADQAFSFQEDGTYVFELTEIHYAKSVALTISTSTAITFSRVFIKCTVKMPRT
jgi:hypothetical protein